MAENESVVEQQKVETATQPEVKVESKVEETTALVSESKMEQVSAQTNEALSNVPVDAKKEVVVISEAKDEAKLQGEVKEALSEEIKKTESELSVINEVRSELVAVYAQNKQLETEKESLRKELDALKADYSAKVEKLSLFEKAEKEYLAKKRAEKVEQLSKKFSELGQEKTVEQLEKLDDSTLNEFDSIVSAALDKVGEKKELPSVTKSSQAVEKLSSDVVRKTESLSVAQPKKATNKEFFAGICKTLQKEQASVIGTSRAKRL